MSDVISRLEAICDENQECEITAQVGSDAYSITLCSNGYCSFHFKSEKDEYSREYTSVKGLYDGLVKAVREAGEERPEEAVEKHIKSAG